MPEEKYAWRPAEGVRSIGEVYVHIAGANYLFSTFIGAKVPAGITPTMEKTVTKKAEIVELLNDDTEVTAGWAEPALARFADPTVGAVAPLVLRWPDGRRIDSAGDTYHLAGFAYKRGNGERLAVGALKPGCVFGASG